MPKYAAQAKTATYLNVHATDAPRWCGLGTDGDIRINHYTFRSLQESEMKKQLNKNGWYSLDADKIGYFNSVEDRTILNITRKLRLDDYVKYYGGYI